MDKIKKLITNERDVPVIYLKATTLIPKYYILLSSHSCTAMYISQVPVIQKGPTAAVITHVFRWNTAVMVYQIVYQGMMRQIVSNQTLVSNGGMQATGTTECMKWVNV